MSRRDVVLMLAQHLCHWPHISPTLVLASCLGGNITVSTCRISAGPMSKMLVQPQTCIGTTLH